ncbi:MAG: Spermidine/putrescine import ATP-binding protein PotA [Alphaproteobacteria bacterium MarineAlpha10_Bin3]|jgi:iron(III) transport system ATP-binding protein|nr:MAG: Spermidine/putrescine import ATP-binding protein PotA [Alphaproteobacteria bacterium MarineAlpha10_Bin3]PPR74560.1 MAG: Spermidine/putrescine import ATP-binding protein PotA [Alphaproteobacteria bacterium MarineAlpha4_Bin1]
MDADTRPRVIALEAVQHRYDDVVAIAELSLSVDAGEVVCLLGPSGCGKTTALRIVAGLEALQQGRVVLNGAVVADEGCDLPPESRKVGFLFQDYALFPHLTVAGNVGFGLRRLSAAARRERVAEALEQVVLGKHAVRYPHELSGGQKQRVALARALAPRPALILLDEPFSGLDARMRDRVRDQTLHALKQSGAATLMVTHDAEEAMFMADRIAVMRRGRLVQFGPPVELYCHPKNAFVAEFFGEVNRFPGIARSGKVMTPFGALPARGLKEGDAVDILIRPEALRLSAIHEGVDPKQTVTVIASRMLGRTSLIHLSIHRQSGRELHLHSRMPGRFLPPENAILAVELDSDQAFVFPADCENSQGRR